MAYTALSDIRVLSHRQTKLDRLYVAVDKAIQNPPAISGTNQETTRRYKCAQKNRTLDDKSLISRMSLRA